MTKAQKNEMLTLLGTMGKMANLLPKLDDPAEHIQDCLAACQCLMGNLEGENAPKSLNLLQTIETSLKENKLNILEHIKKLEHILNSEVKAKREALFLPYKASMWDSLESIYLAAKDDSGWDAFVMPIPYYDKKDGKLVQKHWEISYPKNIPLIDYRKYNIEERHPDIIFIHNPYDGYNLVTSVESDFYSERLRNLTDCLVYVPYFVGNGTYIPDHFCTLPACLFAHKVIVQTEEERKTYVNVYKEFSKKNRVFERYEQIGNKFLALGSPKLDKAIATKIKDCEVPPEWEKLINNKKVVFYNTSIGPLLENTVEDGKPSNKYLQKIKSVFEFFKNQKDAVLLWRPHPLLESTINSMRPWLLQEYTEIVNEYKAGGYGIYDDSPDLNRSIALSDIYYGDLSSVTKLFEVAGKRVAYQLFDAQIFILSGIYAFESSIWFHCFNLLYKYNKQSKETQCIGKISEQNLSYLKIAENNKKLYFAPYYKNNKIISFDTVHNKFEQIEFKDDCKYDLKFKGLVSFKNFVYFIPQEYPAIMRLNTETNEIEYFSTWYNEAFKLCKPILEAWKNIIFFNLNIVNANLTLTIQGSNSIMFFNMETGTYEIKNIGDKSEQYVSICFDGQNYYINPYYKDYIVKWNKETNETSKIKLPPSFSRKDNIFCNFVIEYLNEHIWLFPYAANNAYKINTKTDEITELPELIEHFGDKKFDRYYNFIYAQENTIYASSVNKGIVEYNINTRKLNFINPSNLEMDSLLFDCENETVQTSTANAGEKIWEYFRK